MKIFLNNYNSTPIEIANGKSVEYETKRIKNINGTVSQWLAVVIKDEQENKLAEFNSDDFAGFVY